MSSRFFARGSSSEEDETETESEEYSTTEETESESETESSSEEEEEKSGVNRFLVSDSDSDSDLEDARRVVRSAKDKRVEELTHIVEEIRNKMKINDWVGISSNFDKLNKQLDKIKRSGALTKTPKIYVKALIEMEDFLTAALGNKEARKTMSKSNAKALNSMRQNLKKNNKEYEAEIKSRREAPEESDSYSDDSESDSDSYESGSEGEGEEEGFEKVKTKGEKKKVPFIEMDPKDISYGMIMKKCQELIMARGRKGTDKHEQAKTMEFMVRVSKTESQRAQMMMNLVSAYFDMTTGLHTHLPIPIWNRCCMIILDLLNQLEKYPYISVDDAYEQDYSEEQEGPTEGDAVTIAGNLLGCLERLDDEWFKSLQVIDPHTEDYMNRLKDEPVILAVAQKVSKYFAKAGAEPVVARISLRQVEHFYYKTEAVYNAMKALVEIKKKEASESAPAEEEETNPAAAAAKATPVGDEEDVPPVELPSDFTMEEDVFKLMKDLVHYIYKNADERTKARAMLCDIYHKSIHNDFYTARDLLLMSHLQEAVHNMDIATQLLFNRTMAQIGLCAFRKGLIQDAHYCLSELYGSGRIREILAQGVALRYHDRTPEQEKLEKRRQMPFHMHINLELLEAVNLICAMLLETIYLVNINQMETKRRVSKSFWRLVDHYDKLTFMGPPENVRDHVMTGTYALSQGDWAKCSEVISALTVWNLLPQKVEVLEMLTTKVKEQALKIYLTIYGPHYSSIAVEQLCKMFEVGENTVQSIVSRLIISEDIHGSWHQPTQTIVMRSSNNNTTKLQKLALRCVSSAQVLVESNEKALALRTGSLREREDGGGKGKNRGDWEGKDGRQGRGRKWAPQGGKVLGYRDRKGGRGDRQGKGGKGHHQHHHRSHGHQDVAYSSFQRRKEAPREMATLSKRGGRN
ncbi:subunit C of eukaryotic translation initiation factor 3 [Chloropicon primus]|uniref:Eukaryotic translation initiation factor 3 subunit C n=2 Tax=Chloropicon primus TaxID=1764295 RepID=A0A5B8MB56_9CHLO|nr:subunit C of eukaryotic translation initiation factor 3 [Chloropicon primus]UPQ96815.1 subunit C of eukaryotic translation initiation factor 3 [Chloropicon primus]|eukprot:QDZ17597.1 subunit C of eukaryotic translation initiation factor 3 [Chloropicon primus]